MNAWTLVALAAILAGAAVEAAATWLNLRALAPEPPADFRHVYDVERYRRSQAYTRAASRFGLVTEGVELAALVAFWLVGGFGWLDGAVRSVGLGPVPTGLLFLAALALGQALLGLPFRWWHTFVIEERFGFNRTTPRTFWTDTAKGALLAVALGTPLAAAVLWLFATAGDSAWLWCWLATAVWMTVVQFVAPTWLLPLFNRFTPLADGALREAIVGYARHIRFPLAGVYVIDGSRRSSKANAFFTGFGRTKRIALFDTLTSTLAPDEVVAVVAHEVGHYRRHHVLIGLALGLVQTGVTFRLLAWALGWPALFEAFLVPVPSAHAGLVLFTLVASPAGVVLSAALHALSRRHEYQADAFAAATTGRPEHLATALERLAAESLANLTPHPLHVALHYSHPPVRARVRRLRAAR
jgi:STE24 endopeptidase